MTLSFAFNGTDPTNYEDMKRRQMWGQMMLNRGMSSRPKTVGEGLNSAANSIVGSLTG